MSLPKRRSAANADVSCRGITAITSVISVMNRKKRWDGFTETEAGEVVRAMLPSAMITKKDRDSKIYFPTKILAIRRILFV